MILHTHAPDSPLERVNTRRTARQRALAPGKVNACSRLSDRARPVVLYRNIIIISMFSSKLTNEKGKLLVHVHVRKYTYTYVRTRTRTYVHVHVHVHVYGYASDTFGWREKG